MTTKELAIASSTIWVVLAAILVMFMQAGFAFLEAGLTRMKNVGHIAAKNVLVLAIASLVYYVVGFGIAFPAVFFVAVMLGLIEYGTAFDLAKWTGLGLIAAYGYVAARLSGTGMLGALLQAASVGLIAALLIVLKALVH